MGRGAGGQRCLAPATCGYPAEPIRIRCSFTCEPRSMLLRCSVWLDATCFERRRICSFCETTQTPLVPIGTRGVFFCRQKNFRTCREIYIERKKCGGVCRPPPARALARTRASGTCCSVARIARSPRCTNCMAGTRCLPILSCQACPCRKCRGTCRTRAACCRMLPHVAARGTN